MILRRRGVLDAPPSRVMTTELNDDIRPLHSPRPNPEKAGQVSPKSLKEIPMSLSALKSTVNTAFDARDGISTSTKGEVREAVDHALELLDKGETRVAERGADGKWKVNEWLARRRCCLSFPPQRR